MIGDDAVHLLRHLPVEGPQAGFHVSEGHPHFRGDEGPRERRVRVAVHEDEVRPLLLEDVLEASHHVGGLPAVAPAPDSEVVVRPGDVQDFEEHIRHVLVVMLPRVDQDLFVVLPNLAAHRRGLDELRSCADDARNFQGAQDGLRGL